MKRRIAILIAVSLVLTKIQIWGKIKHGYDCEGHDEGAILGS